MTFDNLGGNVALGFAQSLAATYFCRMCLCTKDETKHISTAMPEKYRTKSSYDEAIQMIYHSSKVDLKETKGITEYCVLNNLECFHILNNWTADVMHDLCEGAIGFLLHDFFELCVSKKILSESEIKALVSNYDYGVLNSQFIPSDIKLERKNLNQSASQMKCLMQHIPFVFHLYEKHPKLKHAWICINSMLKILRICYSNKILETDLIELDETIRCHLENVKSCFKITLKPKHHFLTHYSEIIRRSGPLCHLSTLRFEMKHKELTITMKNNNNFRNVTKSMTEKYQLRNVFQDVYTDKIEHTKLRKIDLKDRYKSLFPNTVLSESEFSIYSVKNLRFNSDFFEKGLVVQHNSIYFEIKEILSIKNDFYLVCIKYDRVEFNEFLVSLEVKPSLPEEYLLIKHCELSYSKTHDKKIFGNKIFILSDSLYIQ